MSRGITDFVKYAPEELHTGLLALCRRATNEDQRWELSVRKNQGGQGYFLKLRPSGIDGYTLSSGTGRHARDFAHSGSTGSVSSSWTTLRKFMEKRGWVDAHATGQYTPPLAACQTCPNYLSCALEGVLSDVPSRATDYPGPTPVPAPR